MKSESPPFVIPEQVRSVEGFDPVDSAGLFVGIRHFADERFAEVPFAVDDAVDLAHLLALDIELIAVEKVVLALSGEPRKEESKAWLRGLLAAGAVREGTRQAEIYDLLDKRGKATGRKGLFVVSLATHGFSDQGSDFLVASDSLHRRIIRTGIAIDEVFDDVARATASSRVVLLDACRERLSAATRAGGADAASAMSQSFADAIEGAGGLVVLSGTTFGGYSYDDHERGNGVFTAAVIDGLRGGAPADERSLITVRSLADYVDQRVRDWVRANRPEHAKLSRGIAMRVEGPAAHMPLAVDSAGLRAAEDYRRRRDAALARLRQNIGGPGDPISGAMYDELASIVAADSSRPELLELVKEMEALDDTVPSQRSLAFYFNQHRENLLSAHLVGRNSRHGPMTGSRTGDRWTDPVLGIEFSYIEPGTFWMGSPASEAGRFADERRHRVTLTRGFRIGITVVTQGQFAEFVAESSHQTDAEKEGWSWYWTGKEWEEKEGATWRDSGGDEYPVVHVSWNDAQAFCKWFSRRLGQEIRLPTEAEWEYAARAGTETATYAGDLTIRGGSDAPELEEIAWYRGNSEMQAHPVGRKRANSWGLYDMLGNVWEWVQDAADWDAEKQQVVTDTYGDDVQDPVSSRGSNRVLRGGSWDYDARRCRAAYRGTSAPGYRSASVGFRLVRTSD
ncbi:MAG: SUMF1/EgtB/PvdO family nonheme iron enzyme [bacterium]|nr:SUMF1/EgtB/PvdO family nonheme iron enzyme [bacterium]